MFQEGEKGFLPEGDKGSLPEADRLSNRVRHFAYRRETACLLEEKKGVYQREAKGVYQLGDRLSTA